MKRVLAPVGMVFLGFATIGAAAAPAAPATQQAASAAAVDPQRLELARRFIGLTQSIDATVAVFKLSARVAAAGMAPDDASESEQTAAMDRFAQFMTAIEPKLRAWVPEVQEADARGYARTYSAAELQQMVSFAESAAGRHYFSAAMSMEQPDPEVMEASRALQAKLMVEIGQFQKQLCAERAAKRLAAGDKNTKCQMA